MGRGSFRFGGRDRPISPSYERCWNMIREVTEGKEVCCRESPMACESWLPFI